MCIILNVLLAICAVNVNGKYDDNSDVGYNEYYFENGEDILALYNEYYIDIKTWRNELEWDNIEILTLENNKKVTQKCAFLQNYAELFCLCQYHGHRAKYQCKQEISNANEQVFADHYGDMEDVTKIFTIHKSDVHKSDEEPGIGSDTTSSSRDHVRAMPYYKKIKAVFWKDEDKVNTKIEVDVANPYVPRPDAGHMQAKQAGGKGGVRDGGVDNLMPQYPPTNQGNGDGDKSWRAFERAYLKKIQDGDDDDIWKLEVTQYGGIYAPHLEEIP
eukprot:389595_1